MTPELFASPTWQLLASKGSAAVSTPVGEICFGADVGDGSLMPQGAVVFAGPAGARLWVWELGVLHVELLRRPLEPRLPPGMAVDGCEAAAWRVRSGGRAKALARCWWCSGQGARVAGSWESGEDLEAQVWTADGWRVSVGTPDAGSALDYRADGFGVRLLAEPGAVAQTHFVVAWARERPDDVSTWFAVDVALRDIVDGVIATAS